MRVGAEEVVRDETFQKNSSDDIASAFSKIDVDGNGSISREELWSHVTGHGSKATSSITKDEFDRLFDAIDEDKSGGIELSEYASFAEHVRKMYAGRETLRSSMKVSTLRESLQRATTPPRTRRRSTLSAIPRSLMRSTSMKRSRMLVRTSRKKGAGKTALHDEEDSNGTKETSGTSVRFFDVEVREYGYVASDHPGVRSGVAVEMNWDYSIRERVGLDDFEEQRSRERSKNFKKEKKLTRADRERILREYGATTTEIQNAAKRAAIIRNKRKRSIAMQDHDQLMQDWENVRNLLRKLSPFGRRNKGSVPQVLDMERLHPSLMVMVGLNGK